MVSRVPWGFLTCSLRICPSFFHNVRLRNKILSFGSIPAQNCVFAKTQPTSTNTVYALFSISNLRHPLVFIIKKNLTPTSWGAPRTLRANFHANMKKMLKKCAGCQRRTQCSPLTLCTTSTFDGVLRSIRKLVSPAFQRF